MEIETEREKGSYKNWSKQTRAKSAVLTTKAEKLGWIKPRISCERCSQTEGILQTHNSDYDVTLRILTEIFKQSLPTITEEQKTEINSVLEILCFRCHSTLHREHLYPAACAEYWKQISIGKIFDPIYKR